MHFPSTALLLLVTTSGLMAFPSVGPNLAYVELYSEKVTNGSLIFLGPPQGSKMARDEGTTLEERAVCPKAASIACSGDNGAPNELCDTLVSELFGDPQISIGIKPRQVCFEGEGAKHKTCCVAWSQPVKGLTKNDLSVPAMEITKQCTIRGVSGKRSNTNLHGVCATVCVSSRGKHCN